MTLTSEKVDYLAVGHVARDLKDGDTTLGGTVAYAGLTAAALGLRVGIITSCDESLDMNSLEGIQILKLPSDVSTTFENLYVDGNRYQTLHAVAGPLSPGAIPLKWRSPKLVHLAPIANEVDPQLVHQFEASFIGITPQGWMRRWDNSGDVHYSSGKETTDVLAFADAVVISIEDLQGDENIVGELAQHCRILAVTRGFLGATIFKNGDDDVDTADRTSGTSNGFKRIILSKRVIIPVVCIVLYTLAGFFLAPYILDRQLGRYVFLLVVYIWGG